MPRTTHGQAFHSPALISPTICVKLATNSPAVSLGTFLKAPAPIKFPTTAPSRREGFTHVVPVAENTHSLNPAPSHDCCRPTMRGRYGLSNASVGHDATRHCYAEADIGGNVGIGAPPNLGQAINPTIESRTRPGS